MKRDATAPVGPAGLGALAAGGLLLTQRGESAPERANGGNVAQGGRPEAGGQPADLAR